MHKSIKALNIETKEVLHFDTLKDACVYFNVKQKAVFVSRCEHKNNYLWRNKWDFAYENNEFNLFSTCFNRSTLHGQKVKLIDLETNDEKIFDSINKLNAYLGIRKGELKFVNNECFYDAAYHIIKI